MNREVLLQKVTEQVLSVDGGNHTIHVGGPAGCGKTAFGIEVVHRLRGYFADGDLFFSFAEQPDSVAEVLREALLELGIPNGDIPDHPNARQSLYRKLTEGRSLVVFLDGVVSAKQIRALQPGPGASLVLVTEARPIDGAAENVFVVDLLDAAAALQMLTGVVGAERIAAEPDSAAELVALCEGLPMALSVVGATVRRAARRTPNPLAETVVRLRDERRRGAILSSDVVFGATYRMLSEPARACYRGLSLRTHGGLVSAAALSAALDIPEFAVEEALIELSEYYLLPHSDDGVYAVRELVRWHSRDVDDRPDDARRIEEERLRGFYGEKMLSADLQLAPARPWRDLLFPDIGGCRDPFGSADEARAWLRRERIGIRAAIEHAYDEGQWEFVWRSCVLLWAFYEKEKYLDDLKAVHRIGIIAARESGNPGAESVLHLQLGFAHYWLCEFDAAVTEFTAAVECADQVQLEASAVEGQGLALLARLSIPEAVAAFRYNEKLARRIDDPRRIALAIFHRAKAEPAETALPLLDTAAAAFAAQKQDETENLAKVAHWRGRKLIDVGSYDDAAGELNAAHEVMSARRRTFDVAEILTAMAELANRRGDRPQARARYEQALAVYTELSFAEPARRVRTALRQLDQSS
ncbi:NB-ARC domain-containing protein [Nocardia nova]|uniref:NB-ARC domain-containing protein n=1 Tax=Nocardia nova TaxID=37330 RepID=UPI0004B6692E|nr:NB-ARC domain-containing protein [Nocardia nova]